MLEAIAVILGLCVVITIVVVLTRRPAEARRAEAERRRRYALLESSERIDVAPEGVAANPAAKVPLSTTEQFELGTFLGREPPPAPSHSDGSTVIETALQSPSNTKLPAAPPVMGRLVMTPDGEQLLTQPPFALREVMFNKRIGRFVNLLSRRLPAWIIACPKVRLDSVVFPTSPAGRSAQDFREWRRRVRWRSIDIVLCDRRTFKPVLAILFYQKPDTQARTIGGGEDRIIDEVLQTVGLPLVRLTGSFQADWPLIAPYVEQAILPSKSDDELFESAQTSQRVTPNVAVNLLKLDENKGWLLE